MHLSEPGIVISTCHRIWHFCSTSQTLHESVLENLETSLCIISHRIISTASFNCQSIFRIIKPPSLLSHLHRIQLCTMTYRVSSRSSLSSTSRTAACPIFTVSTTFAYLQRQNSPAVFFDCSLNKLYLNTSLSRLARCAQYSKLLQ